MGWPVGDGDAACSRIEDLEDIDSDAEDACDDDAGGAGGGLAGDVGRENTRGGSGDVARTCASPFAFAPSAGIGNGVAATL